MSKPVSCQKARVSPIGQKWVFCERPHSFQTELSARGPKLSQLVTLTGLPLIPYCFCVFGYFSFIYILAYEPQNTCNSLSETSALLQKAKIEWPHTNICILSIPSNVYTDGYAVGLLPHAVVCVQNIYSSKV